MTSVKGILTKTSEELLRDLLDGSHKFCEAVRLQEDLITQIIDTDNDWAFVLKVDALLETASKEILREHLRSMLPGSGAKTKAMDEFAEGMALRGKTSVIKLLEAVGFPKADICFIEAVRDVRNAYAHDVRNLDVRMIELIKRRSDKSGLLKRLGLLSEPSDAKLLATHEKNPNILRFGIIASTLRFLNLAYRAAAK